MMSEYFIKPIVKTLMLKGQAGQSIKEIKKTNTSGLVDTYTITLTDGTTSTFTVTNGAKGDAGSILNLKIGGVNLLSGTKNFDGEWLNLDKWNRAEDKYNGLAVKTNTVSYEGIAKLYNGKKGEKYVFSCYAKKLKEEETKGVFYVADSTSNSIGVSDSIILLESEWKRYSFPFTLDRDTAFYVAFASYTSTSDMVAVCGYKLEKEETPTDWSPSLEDIEDTYATKSDVEQKNTSLSERVNALEKADTGWDNLYHNDDGYSYVIAREKNGIFYIIGSSGSTGIKIPANTSKEVATVPNIFWPRVDIIFAVSLKGTAGYASGTITTDGKINIYSTVETYYWGFCISYPVG